MTFTHVPNEVRHTISAPLVNICRKSLHAKVVLAVWKKATVVPVLINEDINQYKEGKRRKLIETFCRGKI